MTTSRPAIPGGATTVAQQLAFPFSAAYYSSGGLTSTPSTTLLYDGFLVLDVHEAHKEVEDE